MAGFFILTLIRSCFIQFNDYYRFSSKMEKTVKLTWSVKMKFFLFSRFSTHSLTFMFS